MRRLFELIYRFRNLLTFLLLEALAFGIVVRLNSNQRVVFQNFMVETSGSVDAVNSDITGYFNLGTVNDELSRELAQLRTENDRLRSEVGYYRNTLPQKLSFYAYPDTMAVVKTFRYIPCRALENGTLGNYNTLVLNVGRKHGVKPNMGVITATGVAGLVAYVSDNYSLAMSLLNRNMRLSVRIKGKDIMGTFNWRGGSTRFGHMDNVPLHYMPDIGDTIITSNFSSIFPEGFNIGRIASIEESSDDGFYDIIVELGTDENPVGTDFNKIDYLYVTDSPSRPEIDSLRQQMLDESAPNLP